LYESCLELGQRVRGKELTVPAWGGGGAGDGVAVGLVEVQDVTMAHSKSARTKRDLRMCNTLSSLPAAPWRRRHIANIALWVDDRMPRRHNAMLAAGSRQRIGGKTSLAF
jgi:hypothetical protein